MAQETQSENLELVRSILSRWERGDFGSVAWAHAEIEYAIVDGPGAPTGTGVPAMRRTWREFLSAWEEYRVEAHEYRVLDDERVMVALRALGRGKASGIEIGSTAAGPRSANVFQLRGGKVMRLATYFDRDRALADLGLDAKASQLRLS